MGLSVSKKTKAFLDQMGIRGAYDVLTHLPRRYDVFLYTEKSQLFHLKDKQRVVLFGHVLGGVKTMRFAKASCSQFFFEQEDGIQFKIVAWNRPYLAKILKDYGDFTLKGSYDEARHELNFLSMKKGRVDLKDAFVPVYSLPEGYPEHLFRDLVKKSFEALHGSIEDLVPQEFLRKYRLLSKEESLFRCHFPSLEKDIREGRRSLKYEEALLFCLKNALIRKQNQGILRYGKKPIDRPALRSFVHSLPYSLTHSQKQAIAECLEDMEKPSLMYRLLQGDVGSGKTLVASLLLFANATRGSQGALMAPTETLAKQHYQNLKKFFGGTPYKVDLLLGECKGEERKRTLSSLSSGETSVIVGTHALFSSSVAYASLGLAIIDEQHKFGVNQRALLQEKGDSCDLLLMSATPIPRTLSLSLFGDLEVSTLTEFPSGLRKITTKCMDLSSKTPFKEAKKAIESGKAVYVVAPQIEGEGYSSVKKVFSLYQEAFPGKCVLLHGAMSEEEKEAAILSFKTLLCPILVATSVVEVGIDVKEASLMIVYEASNFALSSLHQLRGRIGRGGQEGLCLLLDRAKEDDAKRKLEVMASTDDGFKIAEEDLRMRGPGTWAGVKQSGLPDFLFLNLVEDGPILECAREDAKILISNPGKEANSKLLSVAKESLGLISLA